MDDPLHKRCFFFVHLVSTFRSTSIDSLRFNLESMRALSRNRDQSQKSGDDFTEKIQFDLANESFLIEKSTIEKLPWNPCIL